LRLTLAKGGLGIELDSPFRLGALTVTELSLSLTGVRFPVDLSGGVARFRHRRGQLTRLAVEARTSEAVAWATPRLRGILGDATPEVVIAPSSAGVLVGLRSGSAALAFEVVVAPLERDLRLLPERARGIGFAGSPHVLALRALGALASPFGRVEGGAVVVADAVGAIAREILPIAGARTPVVVGVRWDEPAFEPNVFLGRASIDAPPPALTDRALRALELCELTGAADDLAAAGDLDEARRRYLGFLERAPRHPEISRKLCWIDASVGDRGEAALSTLVEAMPATDAGILGGELLRAIGDDDGARVALSRGAEAEPYGPLAALAWLRAAALARELDDRLHALDQAVTRAPSMDLCRWARLGARLDLADVRGAKADALHLEAAARGAVERHAVWRRAADELLARGFLAEASTLFERALRYSPDNAEAVAGLARSLRAAGQQRRSLDLFARASALAARRGVPAHDIEIELARGLAELADDRPAAIARVRGVPPDVPESFDARLLEGRWRAELGDLAGATLALGRLRDAAELALPKLDGDAGAAIAALLVEAASIEERDRGDLLAAQRHLGLAIRLRPRDRSIAAAFRRVAANPRPEVPAAPQPEPAIEPASVALRQTDVSMLGPPDAGREGDERSEADDEALAQRLTDRVRADPEDDAAVIALADVLGRLGRDLDLLALLSARMEEGTESLRSELGPRRRQVLSRLAADARAAGRASEAELYEAMLGAEG